MMAEYLEGGHIWYLNLHTMSSRVTEPLCLTHNTANIFYVQLNCGVMILNETIIPVYVCKN